MKNVLEWLEASESVFPDKAVYMEDSKEITFYDVLCVSQKIGTALADVNGTAPIAVISGRKVETGPTRPVCMPPVPGARKP